MKKKIFSPYKEQVETEILEQSTFESISNWVHDAFLTLIKTKEFKNEPQWICRRLGVSPTELSKVIQNLLNIGLIKVENGQYVAENSGTDVYVDQSTTAALKKLQLDANILSRLALENEPVEKRYHGINTLAIDPDKMDEAKKAIREFRQKFCVNTNWNGRRARVYQLNVSFYPVDQDVPS